MAAIASRPAGSFVVEFWAKSFRVHGTLSGTSSPVLYSGTDLTVRKNQDDLLAVLPLLFECIAREVDTVREVNARNALSLAVGLPTPPRRV